MTEAASTPIANRYDFVYLFDVTDGNPNGDPDAGNQPRLDPETGEGLVTDVCLKRKVRNFVAARQRQGDGPLPGYEIYFQTQDAPNHLRILNRQHQRAVDAVAVPTAEAAVGAGDQPAQEKRPARKKAEKGGDKSADVAAEARRWMCRTFYDVRAFGAVMTTGVNCGQVRGPVQLTFARSAGPILALEHAITRKSVTTEEDAEKQIKKDGNITGTMGRKMTVPYALYRAHGFVSPHLAADTGFGEADLALLWEALRGMFEIDRSASRGQMCARGLYVFKHRSALGNAPSHRLQRLVQVLRPEGVVRRFEEFTVVPPAPADLPAGVELLTFDCDSFADRPTVVTGVEAP